MRISFFCLLAFSLFYCKPSTTASVVSTESTVAVDSFRVHFRGYPGTLPPAGSGEVTLEIYDPVTQKGRLLQKSTYTGPYTLSLAFAEPQLLRVKQTGRREALLLVSADSPEVHLTAAEERNGPLQVSGGPDNRLLNDYDEFRKRSLARLITPQYRAMSAAKRSGDAAAEVRAVAQYVTNSHTHRKELIDWTEKHIGTSPALYGTMLRWTGDDETPRLRRLVDTFAAAHPDWTMTHTMRDKVTRYERVAIGALAPELEGETPSGGTIKLSESLGKATLIDFWASWCAPCISQLPDLHAIQQAYGDRGLVIFGLSVDRKGDRWRAAIDRHEMPWLHASDLAGWDSPNANRYNVTFVPYNVLLDAEGRIVGKNLHEHELREAVAKLLDQ